MFGSLSVHAEMLDAVRCLRAEGIKTALLTNNFNLPNSRRLPDLDASLFDVVSHALTVSLFSTTGSVNYVIINKAFKRFTGHV